MRTRCRRPLGMTAVEQVLILSALGIAIGTGIRSVMTHTLKMKYLGAMDTASRASGGPRQFEPYFQHTPNTVSTQQSSSKAVQHGDGSHRRDEKSSATVDPGAKEISATEVTADDWWR